MLGSGDPTGQQGVFGNDLATLLDPSNRLYRLAQIISWNAIEHDPRPLYARNGRPSLPVRSMAGLAILKHTVDFSDEALVEQWRQNPYWPHFCGETHLQWRLPCDPSEMTRFRKRIGAAAGERILIASLDIQKQRVAVSQDVAIDSTAQGMNITYPTFSQLTVTVVADPGYRGKAMEGPTQIVTPAALSKATGPPRPGCAERSADGRSSKAPSDG